MIYQLFSQMLWQRRMVCSWFILFSSYSICLKVTFCNHSGFFLLLCILDEKPLLSFAHADQELQVEFQPHKIYMSPKNGRVYHPAHKQYGSIGLIRSKLAIEISKFFEFRNGEHAPPTHFTWQDVQYELEADWLHDIQLPESRECL